MKKVAFIFALTFALVLGACSQQTTQSSGKESKSNFPSKSIELIVPYAAGGSSDIIARTLANAVSKYLPNNQAVVVINKPGGSGTIGLTEVERAKPDGYTLGLTTTTATSIQPHFEDTPFNHDSFQAVIRTTSVPQVLVVKSDAPWKTFEEWLEYVKKNPSKFTYAIPVKTGSQYIAMEALSAQAGIKTKAVPFDGAAPAITALLGGHVQGLLVQSVDARAQVKAGTVREIVNVGSNKIGANEDTPLLTEKEIDVAFDIYSGILAPKGIPTEVLDSLNEAFKKAMEEPEVMEQFKKMGIEPSYAGSEDFQKEMTDSFNAHGVVMKDLGLIK